MVVVIVVIEAICMESVRMEEAEVQHMVQNTASESVQICSELRLCLACAGVDGCAV